jgi:sugar phosphate isomerase/epimerase
MNATACHRREFLAKSIALGAGATLTLPALAWTAEGAAAQPSKPGTPNAEKLGWRLCCQLYTFRDRSFYEALPVLAGLGIRLIEPGFFLPLSKEQPQLKTCEDLTAGQRREMKQRMEDHGMKMASYYGPIDKDPSIYRKVFDFSKEMGAGIIVAEPPPETFEALDKLCAEYEIKLAVHNHPEGSGSKYWNPDTLVKACEGRSERIGGCPDTGHWVRSGLNVMECLRKYQKHIITIHLKDAAESGKRDSRDVPLGTGQANYTAVLRQLRDWKWKGVMTIEYEHLSPELVQDVAQCVKFVEDFAGSAGK